jgi:hypothetical protein
VSRKASPTAVRVAQHVADKGRICLSGTFPGTRASGEMYVQKQLALIHKCAASPSAESSPKNGITNACYGEGFFSKLLD